MNNEEAIERIKHLIALLKSPRVIMPYCKEELQALDLAIKALENRPTGHWEYHGGMPICSECQEAIDIISGQDNYCPNCGARMEAEDGKQYNNHM